MPVATNDLASSRSTMVKGSLLENAILRVREEYRGWLCWSDASRWAMLSGWLYTEAAPSKCKVLPVGVSSKASSSVWSRGSIERTREVVVNGGGTY